MRLRFYISFVLFFILKVGFCGNNLDKPDFESWEINSNHLKEVQMLKEKRIQLNLNNCLMGKEF